jgi:type IV pilus assembly protein PilC
MMSGSFWELFQSDPSRAIVTVLLVFVIYLLLGLLPVCGILYLIYFLLTLPMRRSERVRLFIDILTLGVKDGRTPEAAITEAASSHDYGLGVRFHLVAAYLEKGMRLSDALAHVPRMLPPEINAMLKVGEHIGDIGKVLPACRRRLADGVARVRSAHNYLILLLFVFTPVLIFLPIVIRIKILPSYEAVFAGMMEGDALPAFTRFVFASNSWVTAAQIGMVVFLWAITFAYLAGPRLRGRLRQWEPGLVDRFLFRLPWRKKRAMRDFSAMLAVLLDASVPEPEALSLAGQSTGNTLLERSANKASALLGQGIPLPEAICRTYNSPELRWRLGNALRQGRSFLHTLSGWHEALDAQAFQNEQAAAQIATTLLVLFNGLLVGSLVIAIFLALIQLLNQAVLW